MFFMLAVLIGFSCYGKSPDRRLVALAILAALGAVLMLGNYGAARDAQIILGLQPVGLAAYLGRAMLSAVLMLGIGAAIGHGIAALRSRQ